MNNYILNDVRKFKGEKEVITVALAFYDYINRECNKFFLNIPNPSIATYRMEIDLCDERLQLGLDLHHSRYSCNMNNLVNIATVLVDYLRNDGYVVDDEAINDQLVKLKMTKACEEEYGIPRSYTRNSKSARSYENELILKITMG
jgi:hypothetical protein